MKTSDKTVVHNLGLEACGGGANMVAADVKDGKACPHSPHELGKNDYTKEELNYNFLRAGAARRSSRA